MSVSKPRSLPSASSVAQATSRSPLISAIHAFASTASLKSVGSWTRHRSTSLSHDAYASSTRRARKALNAASSSRCAVGLCDQLSWAESHVLTGTALRITRELEDAAQVHERTLVVRRLCVDLGPERDRLRELTAHVFDLREQIQRREIFGMRVEHLGDFALGVVELTRLYEELRVLHPGIDGLQHEASD